MSSLSLVPRPLSVLKSHSHWVYTANCREVPGVTAVKLTTSVPHIRRGLGVGGEGRRLQTWRKLREYISCLIQSDQTGRRKSWKSRFGGSSQQGILHATWRTGNTAPPGRTNSVLQCTYQRPCNNILNTQQHPNNAALETLIVQFELTWVILRNSSKKYVKSIFRRSYKMLERFVTNRAFI